MQCGRTRIIQDERGADAQIVQGLMEITRIAVDGSPCEDVAGLNPDFVDAMGFDRR